MLCAIYGRVSTPAQEASGSLDRQLRELRAFAAEQGWTVVADERDVSSGNLDTWERPGFARILGLMRSRKKTATPAFEVLVVEHEDRIARDKHGIDLNLVLRELCERSIRLATLNPNRGIVDIESADGKMMRTIVGAVATREREMIKYRTLSGRKDHVLNKGGRPHARPPLGYTYDDDNEMVRDPVYAPTVERLYELLAAGKSTRAVVNTLKHEGLSSRPRQGRTIWLEVTTARRQARRKEYVDGVWHPARSWDPEHARPCPPLVDRKTWEAAQKTLGQKQAPKRKTNTFFLLRGIAKCASCGYGMRAQTRTNYKHLSYYRCARAAADPANEPHCDKGRCVRAAELDDLVWGRIVSLISEPTALEEAVRKSLKVKWKTEEDAKAALAEIDARLKELGEERQRITLSYQKKYITEREMDARMEALLQERGDLLAERSPQEARASAPTIEAQIRAAKEHLLDLRANIPHLTGDERTRVARSLLDKVLVDADNGKVEMHFAIPLPDHLLGSDTSQAGPPDLCSQARLGSSTRCARRSGSPSATARSPPGETR